MVHTTRAIVLHKTNYSESSLVVQVYTFEFGRLSLLVHGAKKKKSRNKSALFEPLSLIEIAGNFSNTEKLIRPTEVKINIPLIHIQSSIHKRLIALFISEVLHKCVKESFAEKDLYLFIENSLQFLDQAEDNVSNFHLVFLMNLSKYIGFYPLSGMGDYFSVSDGQFSNVVPISGKYLSGDDKDVFHSLLGIKIDRCHELKINNQQRKIALKNVLEYYQIHNIGMGEIKSHHVLETIFL